MAFDETMQECSYPRQPPNEKTLTELIQRLFFFYTKKEDAERLVSKLKKKIYIYKYHKHFIVYLIIMLLNFWTNDSVSSSVDCLFV